MKITSSYLFLIAFIFSVFLLGGISLSAQEIVVPGMPIEKNSTQDPPATVITSEHFKKHAGETIYLNLSKVGDAVVNKLIIGKAPQPGTPAFAADDTNRIVVYANATQQQIDQAKAAEYGFFSFASILGSNFKAEQLPQTAALFNQVNADLKLSTDAAKDTFRRHHPLRDGGFSYPSDHAANMFFYARLLTEIYPAQAKEFYQYARQVSQDRVILGGHYPADIVAGEAYGFYLATEFLSNPSFQQKWNEVKSEITTLIPSVSTIPVE
ncbi:MAG: phosphatase PAP2 family protein [Chthoniobacterales bacterium]|nr:phosphatase PAP2 family protein [Chthoniobacterales bacterium]